MKLWVPLTVLCTVSVGEMDSNKQLSVLLITGYFKGHLFPVVSLGEELVRRGHNVTLCTTVMKGSQLLPQVPERVGINFLSAGYDNLTDKDHDNLLKQFLEPSKIDFEMVKKFAGLWTMVKIRQTLDELGVDHYDIIVCDGSVLPIGVYYTILGKKVIAFSSLIPYVEATTLEWPYTTMPVDTFTERLVGMGVIPAYKVFLNYLYRLLRSTDEMYGRVVAKNTNVMSYPGIRVPLLITTVVGFDFPKIQTPLTHYVGPVLMGSLPPLDQELKRWLNVRQQRSVVYISMGTTGFVTVEMARAIVDGVLSTHYDAVWTLRDSNRDVLEGLQVTPDRFYLANWVPQQTVLAHPAIGLTILHCGLNGVQESLYNSLPIICIPYANDQSEIALRVQKSGVGIPMYSFMDSLQAQREFTSHDIADAMRKISSDQSYSRQAGTIRWLYLHAGGARRAAELVEFYEEVGYDHLIPAYVKYEWTWIQYYNVDVCLLFVSVFVLWLYVSYKILVCCLRRCCRTKKKTKSD